MTVSIWSYLIFTFWFHACLVSVTCRPGDDPVNDWKRGQVTTIAFEDLCNKGGSVWFYLEEWEKVKAKRKCTEAYNHFVTLNLPEERAACVNAAEPDCRPLPDCNWITRGCTFKCSVRRGDDDVSWVETIDVHLPDIVRVMNQNLRRAYP